MWTGPKMNTCSASLEPVVFPVLLATNSPASAGAEPAAMAPMQTTNPTVILSLFMLKGPPLAFDVLYLCTFRAALPTSKSPPPLLDVHAVGRALERDRYAPHLLPGERDPQAYQRRDLLTRDWTNWPVDAK